MHEATAWSSKARKAWLKWDSPKVCSFICDALEFTRLTKNSSSVLSQWSQIKKTKGRRPLCSCSGKTEAEPEGTFFVAKVYMHIKTNINFNMPGQVLSKQISSVNQIKRQDKHHDIHGHIKINCNDLGL